MEIQFLQKLICIGDWKNSLDYLKICNLNGKHWSYIRLCVYEQEYVEALETKKTVDKLEHILYRIGKIVSRKTFQVYLRMLEMPQNSDEHWNIPKGRQGCFDKIYHALQDPEAAYSDIEDTVEDFEHNVSHANCIQLAPEMVPETYSTKSNSLEEPATALPLPELKADFNNATSPIVTNNITLLENNNCDDNNSGMENETQHLKPVTLLEPKLKHDSESFGLNLLALDIHTPEAPSPATTDIASARSDMITLSDMSNCQEKNAVHHQDDLYSARSPIISASEAFTLNSQHNNDEAIQEGMSTVQNEFDFQILGEATKVLENTASEHEMTHCVNPLTTERPTDDAYSPSTHEQMNDCSLQYQVADQVYHNQPIRTICFDGTGSKVSVGTNGKQLLIYDVVDHSLRLRGQRDHCHVGSLYCSSWNIDSQIIATGSNDKTIQLTNAETYQPIGALKGHHGTIRSLCFSSSFTTSNILCSAGSGDFFLRLWDVDRLSEILSLDGHTDVVSTLSMSPTGQQVLSGGNDCTLRLWDIRTGCCEKLIASPHSPITSCTFQSPHRTYFIHSTFRKPSILVATTGHADGSIYHWDLATGKSTKHTQAHQHEIRAITHHHHTTLAASFDGSISLHNTNLSKHEIYANQHTDKVLCASWHPVKLQFVTCSADKTVKLWSIFA